MAILFPLVFVITVVIAKVIVLMYNYICLYVYNEKIKKLITKKDALQRELDEINDKKIN